METVIFNDTLRTIHERKSVRNYTGEQISRDDINTLLRAAMAAPAAMHLAAWKFIIITDQNRLRSLENGLPFAKMLTKAGTGIVVCAVPGEAALGSKEFAILDCACASENILLAAEALGLGAVWTAVYPNHELMNFVRKELKIPEHVIPLNIIPLGYPTSEEKPVNKFNEKNIHWNKW